MTGFRFSEADDTYDGHAIESSECISHSPLLLELLFAEMTPGLQVVWIAVVFDEACWAWLRRKHMPADDRGNPLAVCATVDHHWFRQAHAVRAA